MTYSLNMTDPFADGEDAVLVVPEDKPDPLTGVPAHFVESNPIPGRQVKFMSRCCSTCGRVMVIPQPDRRAERLFMGCPSRHEAETVDYPEGFTLCDAL